MNKYKEALLSIKFSLGMRVKPKYVYESEKENFDILEELVEKATPKKGILKYDDFGDGTLCCPNCKNPIINVWNKRNYKPKYCHCCGQRIDWE